MEAVVERVCGLDVHQATVVACLLVGDPGKKPQRTVRTFSTVTRELQEMCLWLQEQGCTHIAMESTGVYWKPVYAVLERAQAFTLVVGNAQHIKNVPGRKTDVKDSEWIATLVRHGLITASFVPPKILRRLRDLLRYRRKLVEARTAERNRVLKVLESANIKLASVASDVFGVSGRAMLDAILANELTPREMAKLARGRLKAKLLHLELALEGSVDDHHRLLLRLQLKRVDGINADVEHVDDVILEHLAPFQPQLELLQEIPGVDWVTAATIIAEIGVDMSVFASKKALAAWAGVAPGNNESAGKHKRARSRRGNVHLRTALIQAAICASRTKGTYLKDKFHRLKARRGAMRAAVAVAHKILDAAYHILSTGEHYEDLGERYLDALDKHRTARHLIQRLAALGFTVKLEEPADVQAAMAVLDGPDSETPEPPMQT
jgi:transposase